MKALTLFATCLVAGILSTQQTYATTAKFKFKHTATNDIEVYLPINNTYFWGNKRQIKISPDSTCVVAFPDKETGFITIRYNTTMTSFFIKKGDRISITVDTLSNQVFHFEGTNAEGQNLFLTFNQSKSISSIAAKFKKDSTVYLLSKHMKDEKDSIIEPFITLYNNKKVDFAFFTAMQLHLDYLYAAAAASVVSERCIRKSNVYKKTPKEHEDYWQQLFTANDLNRKNGPGVLPYIEFVKNYVTYYLPYKRVQQNDTILLSPEQHKQREAREIRKNISNNAAYVEGWILNLYYIQEHFEEELPRLFAAYKKKYPFSSYSKYIEPANQKVVHFYASISRQFDSEEIFIKDYAKINSFEQLKEKIKGKMFYVDMWASWCGPCRDEFRYKDALIAELKKHNIGILYLSLDFDASDKQWKNLIKYYKLTGLHIRANELLSKDIYTLFGIGTGISIPRYLLINKNGDIVEKEAYRPSNKETLFQQIRSHL